MAETRTCTRHLIEIGKNDPCPRCEAWIANAPDPSTMTPDQREAEYLELMNTPMQTNFDTLHKRAELLVGGPVWTHMFAFTEQMVRMVRREDPGTASPMGQMETLADYAEQQGKPVAVVVVEDSK